MAVVSSNLAKMLLAIAMKLVTTQVLEELLVLLLENLAKLTNSTVDDELVDLVRKQLGQAALNKNDPAAAG